MCYKVGQLAAGGLGPKQACKHTFVETFVAGTEQQRRFLPQSFGELS